MGRYCRAVLESLQRRPRGRQIAALLCVLTNGRVPSPLSPAALGAQAQEQARLLAEIEQRDAANLEVEEFVRMREARAETALGWAIDHHDVPDWPVELGPASQALLEALEADGSATVLAELEPADRELIEGSRHPVLASRRLLGFGAARGVPVVLQRTGLLAVEPPEDVHAMCRGPECMAGAIETADMVLGALERAGGELPSGDRVLDFGCSSGRITRVMGAARPDVSWMGCDPNEPAVRWAAGNLPPAEFFVSRPDPPLPLEDGRLDMAYAISIWSHFDAPAGLGWLAEMHRVLRPGGLLVMTTAGLRTAASLSERGVPEAYTRAAWSALSTSGFWWADSFGPKGDWGVVHREWGAAYLTPEWLLTRILPAWSVQLYEPGRLLGVQDLYVLERSGETTPPGEGRGV